MRLGILFPVAIFIVAVVFLGWFLSAAMRHQAERNEKKHHNYAYCRHRRRGGYAIGLVVIPGLFARLSGKDCRIISSTQ